MAFKRSGVRLPLAPPAFATAELARKKRGAEAARRSPTGEGGRTGVMTYVYLLESARFQGRFYIGLTHDLRRRLVANMVGDRLTLRNMRPGIS